MFWTKLPIVFVSTLALYVAFTPPHASKKEERIPENVTFADMILTSSEYLRKAVPKIYVAIGLLEMLTILGSTFFTANLDGSPQTCVANLSPSPLLLLGAGLITIGSLIRYCCYQTLKKYFTFEFTIQKDHTLITSGPYQFVRHPSYTGLLLIYIGTFFYFLSPGSWLRACGGLGTVLGQVIYGSFTTIRVATFWALLKRMYREDAALQKEFGEDWDRWAASVRYRLIPGVY